MMIRITLDTSCINLKQNNKSLNQIEEWHKVGLIEIQKTSVMDRELRLSQKKKENLEKSSQHKEHKESGRYDESEYNHSVYEIEDKFDEIKSIIFPEFRNIDSGIILMNHLREYRDILQLATHYKSRYDIFMTLNKRHFIDGGRRKRLKQELGITIMTPREFVDYFQKEKNVY